MTNSDLHYSDVEFSRAKHIEPTVIQKYKANKLKVEKENAQQLLLDDDIIDWIAKQNPTKLHEVSNYIRNNFMTNAL